MLSCCNCFTRRDYHPIESSNGQPSRFGVRHVQCMLVFWGLGIAYALRVNLSVAIVAMTDRNGTNPDFEEFDWDERTKSYLLSSFFWGYVITQVPGGYLSHTYGAKFTFFFGILICSCLAVLTPIVALMGDWPYLLGLRATQGLCQGMIFPATHTFISKWAPVEERGQLVSFCYSGTQLGTIVMLALSGYIASSWLGWPGIFYISGVVGLIWAVFWFRYCASSPAEHPTISSEERHFIETSRQTLRPGQQSAAENDALKPPLRKILTSVPFLTLIIVHCSNNWGFWTLLTETPTYMKSILGVDIKSNGPLSALPYVVTWILTYTFIFLVNLMNRHFEVPLFILRKVSNTIGQAIPMLALIGLGYIRSGDSIVLAILLLTIAVGFNSATYFGFQVNHIDLASNFAGTLMGITNCAANVMSILAPLMVGLIVTDEENPIQWRSVFFLSAGIYFVGCFMFIIFGRTSQQSWNFPNSSRRHTLSTVVEEEDDAERPLLHRDSDS